MTTAATTPTSLTPYRRIAIGIFDTLPALERAIDGLADCKVGPSHLVLVADRSGNAPGLAGLLRRRGTASGLQFIVGRDGLAHAMAGVPLMPFETLGTVKMAQNLNLHLDQGACVLIVLVDEVESEPQILKVLLATSIDQVQLHDALSPAGTPAALNARLADSRPAP